MQSPGVEEVNAVKWYCAAAAVYSHNDQPSSLLVLVALEMVQNQLRKLGSVEAS